MAGLKELHEQSSYGGREAGLGDGEAEVDLDVVYWTASRRPFECYLRESSLNGGIISPEMYEFLLP